MGQVERYGLYVLVLFIFLILGVAIWGDEPAPAAYASGNAGAKRAAADAGEVYDDGALIEDLGRTRNQALLSNFEIDEFDDDLVDSVDEEASEPDDAAEDVAEPRGGEPASRDDREDDVPVHEPVAAPALREYTIRSGDTLSDIAQRELGSGAVSEWKRIIALNPDLNPNRLRAGRRIKLPARSDVVERIRSANRDLHTGERAYVVRKGDSLSTIASRELGTVKHVRAIMKRNGLTDPSKLRAGRRIILPDVSSARND